MPKRCWRRQARLLFGKRVFAFYVKISVRFSEAAALGRTMLEFAPDHEGTEVFCMLAEVTIHDHDGK